MSDDESGKPNASSMLKPKANSGSFIIQLSSSERVVASYLDPEAGDPRFDSHR